MIGSSGSRLDPSISQVRHVKMQLQIKDNLISKRWGEIYSDHLGYDLPQDMRDESEPITFQQYLANINSKTGKYSGDQLFQAISCDNNPTTVKFMYSPHHKVEGNHALNGPPCILSEELLVNTNYFITRSGFEGSTMSIWDK